MANVQLENGYTRIADALLEALCRAPLPGRHHRVLGALIRLTYGYGKTADRIATSQIASLTCIDRRSVTRILKDLEAGGLIARGPIEPGSSRRIAVVKDFEAWVFKHPRGGAAATGGAHATGGAAATSGVAQQTPLVGPCTPPSIKKERFRERAAESPARAAGFHPENQNQVAARPGIVKAPRQTGCPELLSDTQRAQVRTWAERYHPGKFSMRELAANWGRFRRWHRGKGTRNADWSEVFKNWLTSPDYRPLTSPALHGDQLTGADWNRIADDLQPASAAAS
jgi:phage replication O-like protein O